MVQEYFRESNKAADTHANWLMDHGDTGPGVQWRVSVLEAKLSKSQHFILTFDGARRGSGLGSADWTLWFRDEGCGFEMVSYGRKVLRCVIAETPRERPCEWALNS